MDFRVTCQEDGKLTVPLQQKGEGGAFEVPLEEIVGLCQCGPEGVTLDLEGVASLKPTHIRQIIVFLRRMLHLGRAVEIIHASDGVKFLLHVWRIDKAIRDPLSSSMGLAPAAAQGPVK